ncbi:C-terminal binding protein [Vibrio nigripulchritudo]|uniref:C-terminal binding protein n=1 Tax=Vibrio nigripulchritudo TaxID=28173 RepID=UPI0024914F1F|nr:C-terminal binding protein [Vibrio nigripulchritudo]BDU43045.1 D-isomer specific 2-hydroxyacid dehydrogenase family protein [Vibrio nigripulchritudo]
MSEKKRVVCTDYTFPNLDIEEAVLEEQGYELEAHQCRSEEEVCSVVKNADAVLVQFAPFGPQAVNAVNPGTTVVRYGVGYDNIDVLSGHEHGLKLAYVPDYCTNEVADHTASLLLMCLRKNVAFDQSIRDGYWRAVEVGGDLKPFEETTVGFFGFGRIGKAVLDRLKPFGFHFLVCDPLMTEREAESLGVTLSSSDEFWSSADAYTLHAPATEETIKIINKQTMAKMKSGALVVNTARGELVDEAALAEALQTRSIGGAALDVFGKEPMSFGSPLLKAPNLVLTPHSAWYSTQSMQRLQRLAAEEIVRGLKGQTLRCPIRKH